MSTSNVDGQQSFTQTNRGNAEKALHQLAGGPSTARQHPQCPPPRKPCSVSLFLVVFESSELMSISDILILTGGAVL